jgi:hypothetical protein
MWMLNYAFPYTNARIDTAYARMASALADALNGGSAAHYLNARTAFKKLLKPDDYRYFAFQCWQEGTARYTEIAVARLAARTHASDPSFLTDTQAAALRTQGDATYAEVIKRLRTIPLGRAKRVDFYALGAGEALLLDRVAPGWRKNYLDPRMDLGVLFNPADAYGAGDAGGVTAGGGVAKPGGVANPGAVGNRLGRPDPDGEGDGTVDLSSPYSTSV